MCIYMYLGYRNYRAALVLMNLSLSLFLPLYAVLQDIVLTLIKEAMAANSSANGFLIDGYPRELEQGTRFESEVGCYYYY